MKITLKIINCFSIFNRPISSHDRSDTLRRVMKKRVSIGLGADLINKIPKSPSDQQRHMIIFKELKLLHPLFKERKTILHPFESLKKEFCRKLRVYLHVMGGWGGQNVGLICLCFNCDWWHQRSVPLSTNLHLFFLWFYFHCIRRWLFEFPNWLVSLLIGNWAINKNTWFKKSFPPIASQFVDH